MRWDPPEWVSHCPCESGCPIAHAADIGDVIFVDMLRDADSKTVC